MILKIIMVLSFSHIFLRQLKLYRHINYHYFLGGLLGIFENYGAYQRYIRTTTSIAKHSEKMLEMCDMIYDPECTKSGKHCDPQEDGYGEQFILNGSATRKLKDFKVFLTNDANKKQLCEVLLKVWGREPCSCITLAKVC